MAGALRLDLAQFQELAAFTQFSTDLDEETKQRIERGRRLTEVLKQPQYTPMSLAEQVVVLLTATTGTFDSVPVEKVKSAQEALLKQAHSDEAKILDEVNKSGELSEANEKKLLKLAETIVKQFEVKSKSEEESKEKQ